MWIFALLIEGLNLTTCHIHQIKNLDHSRSFLERKTGFEPATFALARQRSTNWATPALPYNTIKFFSKKQLFLSESLKFFKTLNKKRENDTKKTKACRPRQVFLHLFRLSARSSSNNKINRIFSFFFLIFISKIIRKEKWKMKK